MVEPPASLDLNERKLKNPNALRGWRSTTGPKKLMIKGQEESHSYEFCGLN